MNVPNKMYIDVDAMFDTRLSMLQSIMPYYKNSKFIIDYITRQCDNFDYVNNNLFLKLYARRTVAELSKAKPTGIYKLFGTIISANEIVSITVNTYPYPKNTRYEQMLTNMISGFSITTICEKPTVELWQDYEVVLTYDAVNQIDKWLHFNQITRNGPLAHTTIYTTPTLRKDLYLSKDKYIKLLEHNSTVYKGYANVNLITPSVFSIDVTLESTEQKE